MRDLDKLKSIALEEKISQELQEAFGFTNDVLTQYVIEKCKNSEDEEDFFTKMNREDDSFTIDLASNIYFIVRSILGNNTERGENQDITTLTENKAEKAEDKPNTETINNFTGNFPGLALENKEVDIEGKEEPLDEVIKTKPERKRSSSRSPEEKKKWKYHRKLELDKVYKCEVIKVYDYGLLVRILLKRDEGQGLVHISKISDSRINNLKDLYRKYDRVFCKIIDIKDSRYSLSMKNINQKTGGEVKREKKDNKSKLNRRKRGYRELH